MGLQVAVLRAGDVDDGLARCWDAMPASRGIQADFYDSHAWFASWMSTVGEQISRAVRIPAVLDGTRPVALLPMVAQTPHRWVVVGSEARTRARPVVCGQTPHPEQLGLLAESLGRAGARELLLFRMPARDAATHSLVDALRHCGFRVAVRERSCDRLALVGGGWAEHVRRFRTFDQSVRRFTGRIRPLWDLVLQEYGSSADGPAASGFGVYCELYRRSWKGGLSPEQVRGRQALVRHAERLGWVRLYILRVGGVPAAAHLWFRLGDVATWHSTAYDQQLSALSPGTIVQWWAQERIFAERPPRLVDLLPGSNPQKDRIAPECPPLLVVEAARRTVVSGATFPVRNELRRAVPALRQRLAAWRSRRQQPSVDAPSSPATRVRTVEITPGAQGALAAGEKALRGPVVSLPLDPAMRRYLAVAAGSASAEAVAQQWAEGDSWWRVGDEPAALLRVSAAVPAGGPRVVEEVVRLDPSFPPEGAAACVAAALGEPLAIRIPDATGSMAGTPVAIREPNLPWPAAWRHDAVDNVRDLFAPGTLHPGPERRGTRHRTTEHTPHIERDES